MKLSFATRLLFHGKRPIGLRHCERTALSFPLVWRVKGVKRLIYADYQLTSNRAGICTIADTFGASHPVHTHLRGEL